MLDSDFEYAPDLGMAVRGHETDAGDPGRRYYAYAVAYEAQGENGGVHPIGQVRVHAGVDDELDKMLDAGLSPAETRAFALRLLEVADEAEQIDTARRGA